MRPSGSRIRASVSTATMRPAADLGHRLEIGHEAGLGERGADAVRLLAQPARAVALAVEGVVEAHAAPAAPLGLVHREIGREKEVGGAARVLGEDRDARRSRSG